MSLKQIIVKQGNAVVEEVPAPLIQLGYLLVEVDHSCISIGTELSGVKSSGEALWKKALRKPEQVKKVVQYASEQGVKSAHDLIKGKLSVGMPTGYSASGIVIDVGDGIHNIRPGDWVACAGAQCAYHAEIIAVPHNLCVTMPESVSFMQASTVTLGAIALQGIRRANPTLGECFVVIGLGILGQITVQLLKANGCYVIGADVNASRIEKAKILGLDHGICVDDGSAVNQVLRYTHGVGADGVIVTAASASHEIIATAFQQCRKKGRVILVGDVGLNLVREDFYSKEIDFLISASYGPGRYDNQYEKKGSTTRLPMFDGLKIETWRNICAY